MIRPFFDGRDDAGEVVVGEHHVGRLLGHVGAGDAHGHADVGPLERRRVVDAVAGHRHDVAARLEGVDDLHLVLRRDAAEDVHLVHDRPPAPRRSSCRARRRSAPGRPAVSMPISRAMAVGGVLVVAGDHDALQPGPLGHRDRRLDLGPRPGRSCPAGRGRSGPFSTSSGVGSSGNAVQRPVGHAEHPQRVARHVAIAVEDLPPLRPASAERPGRPATICVAVAPA